jgi:hypothetical protein
VGARRNTCCNKAEDEFARKIRYKVRCIDLFISRRAMSSYIPQQRVLVFYLSTISGFFFSEIDSIPQWLERE